MTRGELEVVAWARFVLALRLPRGCGVQLLRFGWAGFRPASEQRLGVPPSPGG